MISLEECRKTLEDEGRGLSDAELASLRQQAYGLADIVLACFLARRDKGGNLPSKEPSE